MKLIPWGRGFGINKGPGVSLLIGYPKISSLKNWKRREEREDPGKDEKRK